MGGNLRSTRLLRRNLFKALGLDSGSIQPSGSHVHYRTYLIISHRSGSSGTNSAWRHASDGESFLGAQIVGQINTAPGLFGCILIPALALRPPLAILST